MRPTAFGGYRGAAALVAPIPRYRESAESAAAALERMTAGLADPRAFAVEGARLAVAGHRAETRCASRGG